MDPAFDPGALLAHSFTLPRGPRVRLRLLRRNDAAAVRELFQRTGEPLTEIGLARLVRFDPRRWIVICATALIDGHERLVGVGAIALHGVEAEDASPYLLAVDGDVTDGLEDLLCRALLGRARALARSRAA
jgi:hypothetical protein